jgi:hypothetical protein
MSLPVNRVAVSVVFLTAYLSRTEAGALPDDWVKSPLKRFVIDDDAGRPKFSIQLPGVMTQGSSVLGGNSRFEIRGEKGDTIAAVTIVEMAGDEGSWTIENFKVRDRRVSADSTKLFLERTPHGFAAVDASASDFATASFYRDLGPRQVRCDWELRASAVRGNRLLHWDLLRAACDSVMRIAPR